MSLHILPPISGEACRTRDVEWLRTEIRRRLTAVALSGAMAPPRRFVPARDGYWDGYAYAIDPAFPELAMEIARRRQSAASRSG